MIDMLEDASCEVSEFVEGRPSCHLAVQALHHVDLADIVIAGESIGHPVSERFGFLPGYRSDCHHAPGRSPLSDNPVSQEDKTVVDVRDMGFIHIPVSYTHLRAHETDSYLV